MADPQTSRARDVVIAGRRVLEQDGPDALTMRRVAGELGIRAPSLYKHVPHKSALETAIIVDGFEEAAAAFEAAVEGEDDHLAAFVVAYRAFATAHPHVYRLMTQGPLPREHLPPGLEARTAAPLLHAMGSASRARAAWAFIHGMTVLELDARFPADDSTEPAWREGIAALRALSQPSDRPGHLRRTTPSSPGD